MGFGEPGGGTVVDILSTPFLWVVVTIGLYGVAYWGYGKWMDRNVWRSDAKKATPAHMYMDGVEYFPVSRYVLWGYQFKSVAALGPILGPFIGITFGWLPALLWIIGGNFFIGWLQDYGAMMLSVRKEGRSFGPITYEFTGAKGRTNLLAFVLFYLIIISAAFIALIAVFWSKYPGTFIATVGIIFAGVLCGQLLYRVKMNVFAVTGIGLALVVLSIWIGVYTSAQWPSSFPTVLPLGDWTVPAWALLAVLEATGHRDGRPARRGRRNALRGAPRVGLPHRLHGPCTELLRARELSLLGRRGDRADLPVPRGAGGRRRYADGILRFGPGDLRANGAGPRDSFLPPRIGRDVVGRPLPGLRQQTRCHRCRFGHPVGVRRFRELVGAVAVLRRIEPAPRGARDHVDYDPSREGPRSDAVLAHSCRVHDHHDAGGARLAGLLLHESRGRLPERQLDRDIRECPGTDQQSAIRARRTRNQRGLRRHRRGLVPRRAIHGDPPVPQLPLEQGRSPSQSARGGGWRYPGAIAASSDNAHRLGADGVGRRSGQMTESKDPAKPKGRSKKVREGVKGVLYGMAAHGHVTAALRTRMYLEHLFMFITLGDMLGVPVIPPYYSLKILPYAVPNIKSWKQRVFRERDFTDQVF